MNIKKLAFETLTEKIIAAAIEVHKTLGPGFLESIYENALVIELEKRHIKIKKQFEIPVIYNNIEVVILNFAKTTLEIKRVIAKK